MSNELKEKIAQGIQKAIKKDNSRLFNQALLEALRNGLLNESFNFTCSNNAKKQAKTLMPLIFETNYNPAIHNQMTILEFTGRYASLHLFNLVLEQKPDIFAISGENRIVLYTLIQLLNKSDKKIHIKEKIISLLKISPEQQVLFPCGTKNLIPLTSAILVGSEEIIDLLLEHNPVEQLLYINDNDEIASNPIYQAFVNEKKDGRQFIEWIILTYSRYVREENNNLLYFAALAFNTIAIKYLLEQSEIREFYQSKLLVTYRESIPLYNSLFSLKMNSVKKDKAMNAVKTLLGFKTIEQIGYCKEDTNVFPFACILDDSSILITFILAIKKNNIDLYEFVNKKTEFKLEKKDLQYYSMLFI